MRAFINSIRPYLGSFAFVLGCFGLFSFVLGIPIVLFGSHFFGGFGSRAGPQPTKEQLEAAVSHQFWWAVWHRLVPLFCGSVALLCYGFYEAYNERKQKHENTAS